MPRLDSLTGLRWWAAFAVFAHHMTNLAPLPIAGPLAYGSYGVTFFFVLSGFVLTWSARPDVDSRTFWLRRFARIYPSAFVALILAIPVFYSFSPAADEWWVKPVSIPILLLSVFLLQGWSRDPVILFSGNPAAWTLSCEAFFYALFPGLNRLLVKMRRRGALLFALGAFIVALALRLVVVVAPDSFAADLPWPISRATEFIIGMGLAWAIRCGWRPRIPVWFTYAVTAVALGYFTLVPVYVGGSSPFAAALPFANEIIIALCALMIVAVALRDLRGRRSLLRRRGLVVLGEWSYAFYLVHATVIYGALHFVAPQPVGWSNLVWYAVVLVVALVVAAGLHYLVERPFERALRRWWDRRRAAAVVARREAEPAPASH
jgi:peptidoglycan/LPS O-acetylase OafA/YrhL